MARLKPVAIVANAAPWLAPIPTAYLVYERTAEHFGWPWYVAGITGLILEVLGIAIMHTALTLWSWNREKRKSDPAAPVAVGAALVGVYFVAAELLTVFLETVDGTLTAWAPAVFPVLSVAAVAVLALRADHERRIAEVAAGKAAHRASRERLKRERKAEQRRIERELAEVERELSEQSESEAKPEPAPEPQTSHACGVCGRSFGSQQALNAHSPAQCAESKRRAEAFRKGE